MKDLGDQTRFQIYGIRGVYGANAIRRGTVKMTKERVKGESPFCSFHCIIFHRPFTRQKKEGGMRMTQSKKTATYRVVTDAGGGRSFRFYCDISGELCCGDEAHPGRTPSRRRWRSRGRRRVGGRFNRCPAVRPVCLLRHVQRQRRPVSGLRAVGERVPLILPSLRRTAPRTGRLLLPRLRGETAGRRHRRKGGSRR